MRTLYLLDRNVVDIIKKLNQGKKIIDPKKIEMEKKLREIDRRDSLVSPILALIEGQKGRQEDFSEKKEILHKEAQEIEKFFISAKTDYDVLKEMEDMFSTTFQQRQELDWEDTKLFLNSTNHLLARVPQKNKRRKIKEEIFFLAERHKLPRQHLAVILCLSCLYGCENSFKLLKPTRPEKAYNVLSDIYIIPMISLIKALQRISGMQGIQIEFLTCDEGLKETVKNTVVSAVSISMETGMIIQKISYKRHMFPHLNRSEYELLMKEIDEKSS